MNAFVDTIRNLKIARLAAVAGMTIGFVVFFIFLSSRLSTSQPALLFAYLNPDETTRITHQMESMRIQHQIAGNKRQIPIPLNQVADLCVVFAEHGVPEHGSIGYEVFDRDQMLGPSSFIQKINHVCALEGALARTAATFTTVRVAKVHIVLPNGEAFSRQRVDASASIVLKMCGNTRLDPVQVEAVCHLAATAMPSLKPKRILIIDDGGRLLAWSGETDAEKLAAQNVEEQRAALETRLKPALEPLPELNSGSARTEVYAEIAFDHVVDNQEKFATKCQVVRSTLTVSNARQSKDVRVGAISVEQSFFNHSTNSGSQSGSIRIEKAISFAISETLDRRTRESGELNGCPLRLWLMTA